MQKTNRIQFYPKQPYTKKRPAINAIAIFALIAGLVLFLLAVTTIIGDNNDDAWKEKNSMNVTNADLVLDNAIPAIDANRPAQQETATFALG